MAKNKFNKSWMHQHLDDPYVKRAQKEGYRSRAAYKLMELDEGLELIRENQVVVDLGATPGSWSQYVLRKWGTPQKGTLIGLDLLPMESLEGMEFILGDFREEDILLKLEKSLAGRKVDLVLSDMAPNLSGISVTDAARMEYLLELALDFSRAHLNAEGALLVKCFQGGAYNEVLARFREQFEKVLTKKPKASRDQSAETYILGRGLR